MDHFRYRSGLLHAEDVPVADIAAAVGTPFYVYSSATLTRHLRVFQDGLRGLDHLVCYAVKANSNVAVLKLLGGLGAGMDVVSGGEYARVRAAGIGGDRVVFSGVGKTGGEMRTALENGIRQFNVESEPELHLLSSVAQSVGRTAPIAIRGQSGRRPRDPREDLDGEVGRQVRRSARARAGRLCPSGATARNRGGGESTCTSGPRSRIWRRTRGCSPCSAT